MVRHQMVHIEFELPLSMTEEKLKELIKKAMAEVKLDIVDLHIGEHSEE